MGTLHESLIVITRLGANPNERDVKYSSRFDIIVRLICCLVYGR